MSLFLMTAGLGAVMIPLWRGWREDNLDRALIAFEDASRGHKSALLPGTIGVGATGIFFAGDAGYNFFTTGWLVAVELLYLFILFICVPMLGHSLSRVEIATLKSKKKGVQSPEMQDLINDNVPIVTSLMILFLIPVMAWLAEFKPF